ncbi:MAG: hypothetical protein LBL47_04270 [Lactobacillus sp.]|nr:hypothetical protein [Lactobacillus sp.]
MKNVNRFLLVLIGALLGYFFLEDYYAKTPYTKTGEIVQEIMEIGEEVSNDLTHAIDVGFEAMDHKMSKEEMMHK